MKNILVKRTAIMISMTVIVSWTGPVRLFAVQINARDEAINSTIGGLAGTQQPAELAPIRIKTQEMAQGDVYLLARALHLYNQRKLSDARGDLKEVLIENPRNQAASVYLSNIYSKINAVSHPKEVLQEEIKGIESVEKARLGGIYGDERWGGTDGAPRFTTNTTMIMNKANQPGEDLTNKFVAEAVKLEGNISDYRYTATASINYYNSNNVQDNKRIRNATWWMKNEKVQFIMGDTSSYLSRYILNGVNYRGVNLMLTPFQSMFGGVKDDITLLYGKVPYFYRTVDEYIYPRQIAGLRNELKLSEEFQFGTTLAYIWDSSSRIQKIDINNKAKRNGLVGIDEMYKVIPGIWTLYGQTAFSFTDDDASSDSDKALRSNANYFVSDIKTKRLKIYNSYERIAPNFRSYTTVTGFTLNQVTIDREHLLNYVTYEPMDEVNLGLQYSRTRTNLDKRYDRETTKEENYKADIKLMPKNNLPRFSLRGSVWNSKSDPGTFVAPKSETSWDTQLEAAKNLWDTDLSAAVGLRSYSQFITTTNTYGDAYEQNFTLSANKKLFDRIDISPSYTYGRVRLVKTPNRPLYTTAITTHFFDLNLSSGLWDTANLTFDYNLSNMQDFATPSAQGTNNAFTTTFSWPFTTSLGFGKKFVFSPFLSYHYASGTATLLDRTYFASKLEGDYFLTANTKLNLSGEYRDNVSHDPTYDAFGDEFRLLIAYKTVNGF